MTAPNDQGGDSQRSLRSNTGAARPFPAHVALSLLAPVALLCGCDSKLTPDQIAAIEKVEAAKAAHSREFQPRWILSNAAWMQAMILSNDVWMKAWSSAVPTTVSRYSSRVAKSK